jgi:group I intron endonuclease
MSAPSDNNLEETTLPPPTSGIYQIRCIPTDKIYVGSAVNLRHRWAQHRRKLHKGNHHNIHLQNAWGKYGEQNFEFTVLEFVDRSNLFIAEQDWIERTRCAIRGIGFNIFDTAGSPGDAFVQVWEGFVDPEGNEVTITNLFDFCRQNNLDWPSMHRLAKGKSKLKSYKGWTHKNSVRQRDYVKTYTGFIAPDGLPVAPIINLAAFCREHGLEKTHMVAVANGRICSHRGWTHENGKKRETTRTYTGFVNPDGQRVIINNLQAFCRENGLHSVHMRHLISGRRKSHKGWRWRDNNA